MGTNVFKLNADGQYQIVGYIKSDEEIDKETFAKIKEKYPDKPEAGEPTEAKMLRLGILNSQDAEFILYNNYVNACRSEGTAKKQSAAAERAALTEVQIDNGGMPTKIMVMT